jgi:uncharacterized protein
MFLGSVVRGQQPEVGRMRTILACGLRASVVLVEAFCAMPHSADGAGFSCSGALQPDEKIVCTDRILSGLDDDLNAAFTAALNSGAASQQLRSDQGAFLASRRNCAGEVACMTTLYRSRIAELKKASGAQVFMPEPEPQPRSLVDQAKQLLALALKCPSSPVQEGAAMFVKYEYTSTSDDAQLRIQEKMTVFEGLKFPGQKTWANDQVISGVNSATQSVVSKAYLAP